MTSTVMKRSDYKVFPYNVKSLNLTFELHDNHTIVTSTAYYVLADDQAVGTPLVLDGHSMELLIVSLNQNMLHEANDDYTVDDKKLVITPSQKRFKLTIKTKIHPETNTSNEGLYRESPDIGSTFLTQCESMGFRKMTYYPDRPDVMTKFTVRVEADKKKYPFILSNGNKIESGDMDDGRHFAIWEDPYKKPAYLFALVAGDLACVKDTYTTMSGREVSLEFYVEHHNADKVGFAIESLKKAMKWDEDTYGLEYDLDTYMIVATDAFNMGAMENKGLNVFLSRLVIADPAITTDAGYAAIEAVIAHEYFHNWTGNRVTCRDWFQLTLKEGLTVFRDEEFSSDMQSRVVKRIEDINDMRNRQYPEDAGPMAHPIRPESVQEMNNFYTSTVYNKGAAVIRMLHTMLGKDGFRKGMDLYFERHDGQAVTCKDFVNAMANANNFDATQFMATWYVQKGTPVVDVSWDYDEKAETFTLHVKQKPAHEGQKPFHMPMNLGLLAKDGTDMVLEYAGNDNAFDAEKSFLHIRQESQSFVFQNVKSEPLPSLFRNGSAPVKVEAQYTTEDLMFLMMNDSDGVNRYDAGNLIAVKLMQEMVNAELTGDAMKVDSRVIDAFRQILVDVKSGNLDIALAAKMLVLPSETYVGELMPAIHIGLLEKSRDMIKETIATELKQEILEIYKSQDTNDNHEFEGAENARRALKNVCLSYLVAAGEIALAVSQFERAMAFGNKTDVVSALSALINSDKAAAEKDVAVQEFYSVWKYNSDMMDTWLGMQTSASTDGSLAKAQELLQHSVYNETKPGKVRSVIGAFCASGANNFHNLDGTGYNFLADCVVHIDKVNEQVAAGLVSPLLKWKRMDEARGLLMKQALESIQSNENLSDGVSEKVDSALKVDDDLK